MTARLRRPTSMEAVLIGLTALFIAYLLRQLLYWIPLGAVPESRLQLIGGLVIAASFIGVLGSLYGLSHLIMDEVERGRDA